MSLNILITSPHFTKNIEPIYDKPAFVRPALAQLAAYLRNNSDFEIKCLDAKFEQKKLNQLIEDIEEFNPDIIGISAFTYEISDAALLADRIRSHYPGKLIVIGGSHVSAIPEKTMKEFKHFDIGVIGEGEISLLQICQAHLKDKNYTKIPGIIYRDSQNQTVKTEKIINNDAFVNTKMPAWDLLPPAKEYFVQTSRGCPFNCNFCFNPAGKKIRKRNSEDVIDEMLFLIKNYASKRISFGDEAFAADKEFAYNIINKIIEYKIYEKVSWDIQTHVAFIDEELLSLMKRAKISKIELGVESGNDEILKNMGKGLNKKTVVQTFDKLKKYKIKTGAFFIFGHPNETKASIWETIKIAAKLNPDEPIFAIMVPFPGTKIAEYANNKTHGYRGTSHNWNNYRKQINNSLLFANFSNRKLKIYLIKGNLYMYLINLRFIGLIKFILKNASSAISFLLRI